MQKATGKLVPIVAALLALGACSEAVSPGMRARDLNIVVPDLSRAMRPAPLKVRSTSEAPPPGVRAEVILPGDLDPSFYTATTLDVNAGAGFSGSTAYGQSVLNYWANNATGTVNLSIQYNNATVATTSGTRTDSYWFPGTYGLTANASIGVSSCGNQASAAATGRAWNSAFSGSLGSWLSWGDITRSDTYSTSQGACPPPVDSSSTGGGGGGGGGGGWYLCYFLVWTDANGNVVEVDFLGCEAMD